MLKTTVRVGMFCLLAAALSGSPAKLQAQENTPAAEKSELKEGKPKSGVTPFHGKLKAIDKTAKTITIGERTIQITADTKLMKNGKPATIEDAVIGEPVGGAYKKTDSGAMNATSIRFGAKPEAEEGTKQKKDKKEQKEK